MDDALLVRGLERLDDLPRNRQRLVERQRTLRDTVGQRRPLDELHHERARAATLFEAVDLRDVRVIERGQELRFALETREPIRVARERFEQDLDRDLPVEPRITGSIHLAHAARAERRHDFNGTEAGAGRETHATRARLPR